MKYHPDRNQGTKPKRRKRTEDVKEVGLKCSPQPKRAAYDQYGHAGVDLNMRGGSGAEGFGGFASFGDILAICLYSVALWAGGANVPATTCRTPWKSPWKRRPWQIDRNSHPRLGHLRHLPRQRCQTRHPAQNLRHLRRQWLGADAPAAFSCSKPARTAGAWARSSPSPAPAAMARARSRSRKRWR